MPMNATPTQITMSLGFSNRFSLEALDEFYEGVYAACEKYDVDLVGRRHLLFPERFYYICNCHWRSNARYFCKAEVRLKKATCFAARAILGAAYVGLLFLEREKQHLPGKPQDPARPGRRILCDRQAAEAGGQKGHH